VGGCAADTSDGQSQDCADVIDRVLRFRSMIRPSGRDSFQLPTLDSDLLFTIQTNCNPDLWLRGMYIYISNQSSDQVRATIAL